MTKFIFATSDVVSSSGKSITVSSLGRLLKDRDLDVTIQKFDPYLDVDPSTMNPCQHDEVFVTGDGVETDLDLGHYERFIDISLNKLSNVTAGKVCSHVLKKERRGDYLGGTVQVIPYITSEVRERLLLAGESTNANVIITEIGGTTGDIESLPFIGAIRQIRSDLGGENVMYVHCTLLPHIKAAGEIKAKPTQHSVKELRGLDIQPDLIIVRTEYEIARSLKDEIALFCDINKESVIECHDADSLYEVPLQLSQQNIDDIVIRRLQLNAKYEAQLGEWKQLLDTVNNLDGKVTVGLVGKYISLRDAYLSVVESLKHVGHPFTRDIDIRWVGSGEVTDENTAEYLADVDDILVPGGSSFRAGESKISTIKYARENNVPFFGICLGVQFAAVEFSRNILGPEDAHPAKLDPATPYPIVDLLPERKNIGDLSGTLRLGLYPCSIKEDTLAQDVYGEAGIEERHRRRYEFNNDYKEQLEANGMVISGISPDGRLVEMVEIPTNDSFITCQFHPEFLPRPNRPHPIFKSFIETSLKYQQDR